MCMDAIMDQVMPYLVASGKIEAPTGIPKMFMMIPGDGLRDINGLVSVSEFYREEVPDFTKDRHPHTMELLDGE